MIHPDRVDTWGEIAGFLRVDVKTAQRWERERGLPVHRLPGGRRGHVHAYRTEIERWLASGAANGQAAAGKPAGQVAGLKRRMVVVGIAGAALLASGWFGARLIRPRRERRRIASAKMEGEFLVAFDGEGRTLWRHPFEGRSPVLPNGGKTWGDYLKPVDFEGSGQPDLVAAVGFDDPRQRGVFVYCFDPKGGVRWQWPVSLPLLDFDGKPFEHSWNIPSMLVTGTAGRRSLWISVANPFRWGSALMRISSAGQPLVHFANAGSVMELAAVDGAERFILAAGINNAFDTVFLALVGEDDPPSMSPLGGPPRYRYKNGPTGTVRLYVLLPQSELKAGGTTNYLTPDGLEEVGDGFALTVKALREPTNVYTYQFDRALAPIGVRTTAGFGPAHQQLEKAGLLGHPASRCPELSTPRVIRSWTARNGWSEIPIPVADRNNLK